MRHQAAATGALLRGGSWTRDRLLAFQADRLRRLVAHAAARVPYHRDRLAAAGVDADAVSGPDDLTRLPTTNKDELQRVEARALVAEPLDPARLVTRVTSGSTGRPFTIRRTRAEEELLYAFRLRQLRRWGLRAGDVRAQLMALRPPGAWDGDGVPPPPRLYQRAGLFRQTWIHSLHPADRLARTVLDARPDVVHGYPSTLEAIAAELTAAERDRLSLRFVSCAGETLLPSARRRIEHGFGARLREIYGVHEANLLAAECATSGLLHTIEDAVVLEVLRDDDRAAAEGEEGEVAITPLHSWAMPFLRFRLGDLAVRGPTPCRCGAPVATLERVTGRTIGLFVMPDGRRLHP
jgi:phenylacetate-CoA ligase